MAARPKTLTASVVPVTVGTALALQDGVFNAYAACAALVGALLIQVGTNLVNDHYDFKKGADTANRLGPARVTQQGLVAPGTVLNAALACFAGATLVGSYLVVTCGWPMLVIGLTSLLAGYAYTGGPYPLAYHGLGDLFVFVFFGLVAVGGTYYAQAHTLTGQVMAVASCVGALGTALLVVNNLRDIPTDVLARKRTLAVRLGARATRGQYTLLLVVAFGIPVVLWLSGAAPASALLTLLALPLALAPWKLVHTQSGVALNAALAQTARLQLVHGLLLAVGLGW